jgi:hypothetical protein
MTAAAKAVPPVLQPGYSYASVTDQISTIVLARRAPPAFYWGFAICFVLAMGSSMR